MAAGEINANPNTGHTYASPISGNQQSSKKSLKPIILLHGEPTVVFDSKDIETFITKENLKYALIGECNIGLLESRHVLLQVQFKDLVTGEITNVWQKIRYDYVSYYCKRCKHQGHRKADLSGFSPINAYASDLGDDSFDEDGDEEDNMLDICFEMVARDRNISPRHQRSGSNKNKKKTHGRQHSWDGKVTGEFVPRHLPMRLAKQNHMTVSIASTRSNTSKKK
ncbi:hypothetical protein R3W88_032693 [Solanum pinnatisectum]|uniref:Uncharacterized protein n=1 Tax=Solanum pinnatisectum TaxID=50273 RepID=A0AAV9LPW4_9SOLN|nr:hypothetical protein R3W88_032693 [Solanum pinnatisectum]